MGLLAQAGTFTSPASTGLQTVSLSAAYWGSEAPKVVIQWGIFKVSDGFATRAVLGFGIATVTSQAAIGIRSDNNQATSDSHRRHTNAACLTILRGNSSDTAEEAAYSAFNAAEFVLNWTVAQATGYFYNYLALGGDIEASLIQLQSPAAGGTPDYAHSLTGEPDALLLFSAAHDTAPANTAANAFMSVGLWTPDDGVRSVNIVSIDGESDSNTARKASATALSLFEDTGSLTPTVADEITSIAVDGTNVSPTWTADATQRYCWILALKGVSAKLITGDQPATDTTATRVVGFNPKAALAITAMAPTSASVEDDARIGIGAFSQGDTFTDTITADGEAVTAGGDPVISSITVDDAQCFAGAVDEDGQPDTDADRVQDSNEALKLIDHTQTVVGSATVSVSGTDLVETWTDTDGTQREVTWLVLGDIPTPSPGSGGGMAQGLARPLASSTALTG